MISPKGYSKKERDAYKENKQRRKEKEGGKGKRKEKESVEASRQYIWSWPCVCHVLSHLHVTTT